MIIAFYDKTIRLYFAQDEYKFLKPRSNPNADSVAVSGEWTEGLKITELASSDHDFVGFPYRFQHYNLTIGAVAAIGVSWTRFEGVFKDDIETPLRVHDIECEFIRENGRNILIVPPLADLLDEPEIEGETQDELPLGRGPPEGEDDVGPEVALLSNDPADDSQAEQDAMAALFKEIETAALTTIQRRQAEAKMMPEPEVVQEKTKTKTPPEIEIINELVIEEQAPPPPVVVAPPVVRAEPVPPPMPVFAPTPAPIPTLPPMPPAPAATLPPVEVNVKFRSEDEQRRLEQRIEEVRAHREPGTSVVAELKGYAVELEEIVKRNPNLFLVVRDNRLILEEEIVDFEQI
jgi:hypothetical protein